MAIDKKDRTLVGVYTSKACKELWRATSNRDCRTLSAEVEMVMNLYCAGGLIVNPEAKKELSKGEKTLVMVYTSKANKQIWRDVADRECRPLSVEIEMVMNLYCSGQLSLAS